MATSCGMLEGGEIVYEQAEGENAHAAQPLSHPGGLGTPSRDQRNSNYVLSRQQVEDHKVYPKKS